MGTPYEPAYYAPTPSSRTRFFRTFLPWQLVRFVWINLKMVRMISLGRHGGAQSGPQAAQASSEAGGSGAVGG